MAKRRLTNAQRKRHQEAADWVLRRNEASLSSEELNKFQDWLQADPRNHGAYETAERLLGEAKAAITSDPNLQKFKTKAASPTKTVAGLALGLVFAAGLFLAFDGPMRLQADVISGVSELPVIELEDGSSVYLNAESAIAIDISDQVRTVRLLRGEAFFEVETDAQRPFNVEVGGAQVTALGTAFDIRFGNDMTEVTVTHNAVLIAVRDTENETFRLGEGESVNISQTGEFSEVVEKDADAVLAWRRGLLVLDNVPLSRVAAEIDRHFFGRIVILGDDLARRRISGTIAISNTSAALAFLRQALGIEVTRVGPVIFLQS